MRTIWLGVAVAAAAMAAVATMVVVGGSSSDDVDTGPTPVLTATVVDASGIALLGVRPLGDQSDVDALFIWLDRQTDVDDAALAGLDAVNLLDQFVVLFGKESCDTTTWRLELTDDDWDLLPDDLACLEDANPASTYVALVFAVDETDRPAFD